MLAVPLQRTKMSPLKRREARAGLLFVLPWIVGLLLFSAYPVIYTFYLSFTDYNVLQPPTWAGLDNYRRMFTLDTAFWISVKNSAFYALLSVPLRLLCALGLAVMLNTKTRGIGIYRTVYYLPVLVPPVVGTILFILLFDTRNGLVNVGLEWLGLPTPGWLTDPGWAKPTMVIMSLWAVGVETLIFLAGLKEIPQDLLDASALDGANRWKRFMSVTIPLLTPVILFNLVIGIINSFQVFTQALVIGGTRGEPVDSTLMYMVLIYLNAFRYFAMGYASALAVVLFLTVVVLTLIIFRSARFWVYYEDSDN